LAYLSSIPNDRFNMKPAHRRLAAEDSLLPPQEQRRGAYDVVLRAALRLFAERGFGGTSVRDIARAADVQPATLYSHFPSKDHVLAELIRIGHEQHFQRLRDALLESQPEPAQQMAALVRAHVAAHAEFPTLAVVANAELHACDPALATAAMELRKQSEQMFLEVIQRGIRAGVFNVPHAWLALAVIGGAGVRVAHWYTPGFELSVEEVAATYVEYAWRVLGVKERPQEGARPKQRTRN
jgi:AcrR family transcriptional regulator